MRVSLSPSSTCMALARDAAQMSSIPADPLDGDGPCGWEVARLMYGSEDIAFAPGEATLQCPLALGQYMWLREVGAAARVTLSPDYNAAHRDHFHFDMGPYSSCR